MADNGYLEYIDSEVGPRNNYWFKLLKLDDNQLEYGLEEYGKV